MFTVIEEGINVDSEADAEGDTAVQLQEKLSLRTVRKIRDQKAMAILTKVVAGTPKTSLVIGKRSCKEAYEALGAIYNRLL